MMEENKCGFCHTGEEHESVCGSLHKDKIDGKVVCAHHKCMQYSACLVQYKTDSFGGFKKQEVIKEIKRGSRLICAICKADKGKKHKKGATSGCAWASCRKTFHYLCVSMNPRTVAKRYRVAAGDKVVILYRVFCCQDHENRYRENLSADDIVGKNESSDEGGDSDDEEDNSDTDSEPPAKVPKVSYSQLKDKPVKKEEGESGMSSPGMTSEEVLSETQRQLKILQKKNSTLDTKENGNDDSFLTATPGHDSGGDVTDDFNTSNSPLGSEMSENGHLIRNIDEGFHIIIPSKLEVADLKTICRQAGYSEETCLLWPKGYNKQGLQDKHMPYIMWNLTSKLSKKDTEGFVKSLTSVSVEQYESLCRINESAENMELPLKKLSDKINSKYRSDVSCVLSIDEDNFYILLLSLPKCVLEVCDVWSIVNLYQWTKYTVMPSYTTKQLRPSLEKKIMLNWLLPKLHNKSVELNVFPQEETLRIDQGPKFLCVAREIEFQLETISQNILSTSLVKVMILRKVDREVVNFKNYLRKLVQQFIRNNAEHECYCVIHVMPSDGIHMLEDVLPLRTKMVCGQDVRVFSAFNPSNAPVSCLVLYTANTELSAGTGNTELGVEEIRSPGAEDLYFDVDETPTNI
ncbi:uncharacterized protein LOC123564236 [Mercenaria mercenaria]|uniref:uncharacterized protein LOC123564236 n=1 Tax=Mercenaria mercenaria TaxID=6596 RepID=UPI00234E71E7|nr:uncharacterized protein LOC123564236 [Mercenaria mercenaria]